MGRFAEIGLFKDSWLDVPFTESMLEVADGGGVEEIEDDRALRCAFLKAAVCGGCG